MGPGTQTRALTPPRSRYRRFRSTPKMLRWIPRPAGVFMNRRAILPIWIRSWVSTPPFGAGARRPRDGDGAGGVGGGIGFSASACWSFVVSRS